MMAVRVRGAFDLAGWSAALDALTDRHEALRTTFTGRGRRLRQQVHPPRPAEVRVVDLSVDPVPATALDEHLAREARTPIDPSVWPVRTTVWRLGEHDHVLALNLHHLVNDAWSFDVLWRDACRYYNDPGSTAPSPRWQYADFSQWQQEFVAHGSRYAQLAAFWQGQLRGARPPRLAGGAETERIGAACHLTLSRPVVAALTALARSHRATLPAVLMTACYLALREHTGQEDLTVCSMYANRSAPQLRDTVGFVANLLPVRVRLSSAGFAAALETVKSAMLDAFVHQDLPYQVFPLDVAAGLDTVVFNAHARHPGDDPRVRFGAAQAEWLPPDPLGSRFDLEFRVVPAAGTLETTLFYNRARVSDALAADLTSSYRRVCERAAAASQTGQPRQAQERT